jgi:hypothetical protein
MLTRYLKKTLVFSVIAAGIALFALSCENPFTNNLGKKVDVEPPVVKDILPTSGAFLNGVVEFSGEASAFRELHSERGVEVRIFNPEDAKQFLTQGPKDEWTTEGIITEGGAKHKRWSFTLDTTDPNKYTYTVPDQDGNPFVKNGLADGFLRIQFRANDSGTNWKGKNETVELVYIIKNGPSTIRMTLPDISDLEYPDGAINLTPEHPLEPGAEILGNVIDRRGIKPGYPRIKFWKYGEPEPADNDPLWGQATLSLTGLDDYKNGADYYLDRRNEPIKNLVNFSFGLYKIASIDHSDPDWPRIRYQRDATGKLLPLDTGNYHFKIWTRDTFFFEDANDPEHPFMHPDPSRDAEAQTVYKPESALTDSSKYYLLRVENQGAKPNVNLNNSDIVANDDATLLKAMEPHHYIAPQSTKKIIVASAAPGTTQFRLRVLASHADLIMERATLQWQHSATGRGTSVTDPNAPNYAYYGEYLEWDDFFDDAGLTSLNYATGGGTNAENGHLGAWKNTVNQAEGKYYQFTAKKGLTDSSAQPIFTSSIDPYTLTVRVWSGSVYTEAFYSVFVYDQFPTVDLNRITGYASYTTSLAIGGIDQNYYTVNGNIQVAVTRSANIGMMTGRPGDDSFPVVKWVIEAANPSAAGSMKDKLDTFRANPLTPNSLDFFNAIPNSASVANPRAATEGWVEKDGTFKVPVSAYDGQDRWLYIIAQDQTYNLGYTLQRLKVDESSDLPSTAVTGLFHAGVAAAPTGPSRQIDDYDKLYINLTDNPLRDRINVLRSGEGIRLNLKDDDGLLPSDIQFRLTANHLPANPVTFYGSDVFLGSEGRLELNDELRAATMANKLYNSTAPGYLYGGVYKLEIFVKDNTNAKIKIATASDPTGANDPNGKAKPDDPITPTTIFFAVQDEKPVFATWNFPANVTNETVTLSGTVTTRMKLQKLDITFNPDVITPANGPGAPIDLPLTSVTGPVNGLYTYTWSYAGVNFVQPTLSSAERAFTLQAWDMLAEFNSETKEMRIDNDPPVVDILEFNFNRPYTTNASPPLLVVNGKMSVEIDASDLGGAIRRTGDDMHVWLFIQPSSGNSAIDIATAKSLTSTTPAGTNGIKYQFKATDVNASFTTRFKTHVNTTTVADGNYCLYAIAEDASQNWSTVNLDTKPLKTFTISQDSDIPQFRDEDMKPDVNAYIGRNDIREIKGSIFDDDGFIQANYGTYVAIRFPINATTWGGWQLIPEGDISYDSNTENLKYSIPQTKFDAITYLQDNGEKQYQLRIYDEPSQKNPDGVAGTHASLIRRERYLPAGATDNTSMTANPNSYKFTLKNKDPDVWFTYNNASICTGLGHAYNANHNHYDPNECHRLNHAYDPAHLHSSATITITTGNPPETVTVPNPNYNANIPAEVRPTFNSRAALFTALAGRIEDPILGSATFTYGSRTENLIFSCGVTVNGRVTHPDHSTHTWTIDNNNTNGWLSAFDTPNSDGTYIITIKATDTLNNPTSVDWLFTKDGTGPEISFSNISATPPVGSPNIVTLDRNNNINITGQFTDTYSHIANTFLYKFDGGAERTGNVTFRESPANSGLRPPARNGTWSVPIPGEWDDDSRTNTSTSFADGAHTITITSVKDTPLGNETTSSVAVPFIVDRKAPLMITTADGANDNGFKVTGNGLRNANNQPISGPLTAAERVFSAAGAASGDTAIVFTLSGVVHEHNLTELSAYIRNRDSNISITPVPELKNLDRWRNGESGFDPSQPFGNGTGGVNNITGANLRIKKAATTDGFGLTNALQIANKYVWELDVRKGDFYLLNAGAPGDAVRRSIAVTAEDIARNKSNQEVWNFYLDSAFPTVKFIANDTMLEDTTIILQGSVEDETNVRLIRYEIEKRDYTVTLGQAGDWNNVLPMKTYTHDVAATVNLSISEPGVFTTTSDGYYRIRFNVADYSLSAAAGGNNTTTAWYTFYVDRNAPRLKWVSPREAFYKWDSSGNIVFDLAAWDENGINKTLTPAATAPLRGELKNASGTLVGTVTVAPGAQSGISSASLSDTTPASAVTLGVTIHDANYTNPATKLENGRYTLTLFVYDQAGKKVAVEDTLTFYLDTDQPKIAIDPAPNAASGDITAVTGRIQLRGTFTKNNTGDSPMKRVAFFVGTAAPAYASGTGVVYDDAALNTAGWFFATDAPGENPILQPGADKLMQIYPGESSANMVIFDTTRFLAYQSTTPAYIGADVTLPSGSQIGGQTLKFDGATIPAGETVNLLTIWVLAIDAAGNAKVEKCEYYVYPEGDRPKVEKIANPDELTIEANRLLNGRIRLGGTAKDNLRVQNVWFRVLDENGIPFTESTAKKLEIPAWTPTWEAPASNAIQTSQIKTPHPGGDTPLVTATGNGGWFRANIGRDSNSVSWWAYINNNGELDPPSGRRAIYIEVIAEDDRKDDADEWKKTTGIFSKLKTASAWVVSDAPRFDAENILTAASSATTANGYTNTATWGSILRTNVRGTAAAYSVTVKHNAPVGAIYWTNAPASVNVTNVTNLLSVDYAPTYATQLANLGTNGIAVKAEPKDPIIGTTSHNLAAGTYMIWKPFTTRPSFVDTGNNVQYTVFTLNDPVTVNATGAVLLKQQVESTPVDPLNPDKWYEWQVIVDINSEKVAGGTYAGQAEYYPLNLRALDTSSSAPLSAIKAALIPIDNLPPKGNYTHTTNIAGTAQTFGGEAGDLEGNVGGLNRVVLWFSRGGTSFAWNEAASGAAAFVPAPSQTAAMAGVVVGKTGAALTADDLGSVRIPIENPLSPATNNYSSIVIDRHDPLGNQFHHGHQRPMQLAPAGGALGTSWYVSLDSTLMTSGRVTAHYIVYDNAGNGAYYTQNLMILNNVPKIRSITLATDLYGADSPLNLQQQVTNDNTRTNRTYATGGTHNANNPRTDTSVLTRIASAYTDAGIATTSAAFRGVSDPIPIDTSRPGVFSLVFDEPNFMVRNKFLALQINTDVAQVNTKDRYYRVEYVSAIRTITGVDNLTNTNVDGVVNTDNYNDNETTGIRAGRVYMIKDPGIINPANDLQSRFPWGVLGAQGESFEKGVVFLAIQDGRDLELIRKNINGQTINYGAPEVWELNGTYYNDDASTAANALNRSGVPTNLQFTGDVKYNAQAGGGTTAEFVYRNAAFGGANTATQPNYITDFTKNLDALGRPRGYDPNIGDPWVYHSLFIIKIFDGNTGATPQAAEADLFGDFALLSIRVNNNDQTPPYAQLYDLNPKSDTAAAGAMGANRTKGGLTTTGSGASAVKSGHIEPRQNTSLTGPQMGGAGSDSIEYPTAKTNAYFDVDTVSGAVVVRGYAEDNQRIGRVDLEFRNEASSAPLTVAPTANPVAATNLVTLLNRDTTSSGATARYLMQAAAAGVTFTETVELNRHRVEWSYVWDTETVPGLSTVVGNISVRAIAYNANPDVDDTGTTMTPNADHISRVIRQRDITTTNRNTYDTFNASPSGFPASGTTSGNTTSGAGGPAYRYNDIRVNIRPYITGFLRNKAAPDFSHDIRSRQGRYVFARGETAVVTGFNLSNNGTDYTYIYLANGARIATSTPANPGNFGITTAVATRHRQFTVTNGTVTNNVMTGGATTGNGLITLAVSVNNTDNAGYSAVNTPRQTAGETITANNRSIRKLDADSRPVVQPWNKELKGQGSQLWDDYTMMHIWRNDANMAVNVDRGRFAKGAFSITNPSMSIDPVNGRLWESHQEGGRKPTQTGGSLYPGGGAYISNNSSTYPYENTDTNAFEGTTDGLRQVASFSEHMTYTNVFVDNSSRVWAVTNSITKYNASDRWRFLPGMWLWGPVANYDNANGSPQISHFPRTTSTLDNTYHYFPFPNAGSGGLTGMYAVESLWYNGANNSRTMAAPQSTEQFHNPHVVTNAAGTYVHVSYYDSKDGSLKYRYNPVGTTGVVDSETSPRNWVNLDGGADVDDNSTSAETPGKAGVNTLNINYIGNYPSAVGVNPNNGQDAMNSPYAGGTSYTFAQRNGNATPTGNLTKVHVQNGAYVKGGTTIYTVGSVDIKTPDGVDGFIVLNYPAATNAPITDTTFTNVEVSNTNETAIATTRRFNQANHGLKVGDTVTVNGGADRYVLWVGTGANDSIPNNYFKVSNTYTMADPATNVYNPPVATNYTIVHRRTNAFRIYPVLPAGTSRIYTGTNRNDLDKSVNAGRHNDIAVTSGGNPVIAYYDETGQKLKMAVSSKFNPVLASDWSVHDLSALNSNIKTGTGEYVSIQIDTRTDTYHIAAMNGIEKNVVYVTGSVASTTPTVTAVQIVDSVGNVGEWCKLSLTSTGDPWIAYMDDAYKGQRDGVKVAFRNTTAFYKGAASTTYAGEDLDANGNSVTGWEAMHVPTQFRVENNELGMERFPTIRNTGATRPANGSAGLPTFAAVGFLGESYYRIAYYIEN